MVTASTPTHAVRISEWRHLSILSHLPHGFTALQMEKDKALTVAGRRPGRCSRARRPRQKKRGDPESAPLIARGERGLNGVEKGETLAAGPQQQSTINDHHIKNSEMGIEFREDNHNSRQDRGAVWREASAEEKRKKRSSSCWP